MLFFFPLDDGEEDPNGVGSPPAIQIYDGNGSSSSADPSTAGPVPERYDKDVGICTVETALDTQGRETILEITVGNGYPSYWCTAWFPAKNTGSVPVKLQSKTLVSTLFPVDLAFGLPWCIDTDDITPPFPIFEAEEFEACPEVDGDILVQSPEDFDISIAMCPSVGPPSIGIGTQLDPTPSEFDSGIGCIALHVEQGFEQNEEETFVIEMLWVQWNEFVEPVIGPIFPPLEIPE